MNTNEFRKAEKLRYSEFLSRSEWGPGQLGQRLIARLLLRRLIRRGYLSLGSCILEVGSGTGIFASEAIRSGLSDYSIAEPCDRLYEFVVDSLPLRSAYNLGLPEVGKILNNQFDVCVCLNVLEHAKHGYEAREWLQALKDCLKDGGLVILMCPDITSYRASFWDIDWSHAFPTTLNNLRQIANDLDMRVIEATSLVGGRGSIVSKVLSQFISLIYPQHILDKIGMRLVGRPLGLGFRSMFLYKNLFIILER